MASNPLLTMLLVALLLETATAEYLDKATTKAACKSKVNEEECAGHDGALFPPLPPRARPSTASPASAAAAPSTLHSPRPRAGCFWSNAWWGGTSSCKADSKRFDGH